MNSMARTPDSRQVQHIQSTLQARRSETLANLHQAEAEQRALERERPTELGDFCNESAVHEDLLERLNRHRRLLHMIEAALRRIEYGTFGECTACGNQIAAKRLEIMPLTEYCLRCQENFERGMGGGRPPVVRRLHAIGK